MSMLTYLADGDGLLAWFTDTTSTLKEIGTDFKSVSDHMKLYEQCFVSIVAAKNTKAGIQEERSLWHY